MATHTAGRPHRVGPWLAQSMEALPQAFLGELPWREVEPSLASLARANNLLHLPCLTCQLFGSVSHLLEVPFMLT